MTGNGECECLKIIEMSNGQSAAKRRIKCSAKVQRLILETRIENITGTRAPNTEK